RGGSGEGRVGEVWEAREGIPVDDPLVLVLEDLHWVDPSTLDVISALARRRGPAKLMLLCTYRPTDVVEADNALRLLKQDLVIHRLGAELALEALEVADVADYLAAHIPGTNLPARLAPLGHRQPGATPLSE